MNLRRAGLCGLIGELEKLRVLAEMDLDSFYKLAAGFTENKKGKIHNFGWLFHAGGSSDQHDEFIDSLKLALSDLKTKELKKKEETKDE